MAYAKTGAYGVVFVDGSGETRTARSYSHGDPKIAGQELVNTFKAKDPTIKFNPEIGKGLWPINTQKDEEHWSSVEDANRTKQASEGKLTVQELTGDKANLVLEPNAILEGAAKVAPSDVIDNAASE